MAQLVAVVLTLLLSAWMLAAVASFVLPTNVVEDLTVKARLAVKLPAFPEPPLSEEARDADLDHNAISLWVYRCLGSPDFKNIPPEVQNVLTGYPGMIDGGGKKDEMIIVNSMYIRLATLSKSILYKRINIDRKVSSAYSVAQIGVFLSILIGVLTTVLVALNSSDYGKLQTKAGTFIRVGALALPAIGTAVAAAIAFYDPNGNLARQSQVVAGLQQLHSQIVAGAWKFSCARNVNDPTSLDAATRLDAWNQRYQELVASVVDSRAQGSASTKQTATTKQ